MSESPEPRLPQNDEAKEARQNALATARSEYQFDLSYKGYSLVAEVPKQDHYDAAYLANGAAIKLELAANKAAASLKDWAADEADKVKEKLSGLFQSGKPEDVARANAESRAMQGDADRDYPLTLERYEGLYPATPDPASMENWREDWYFAWQRIAGCNPILIEKVREMPPHFPVTDAMLQQRAPQDSLAEAIDEGRLYLVDYAMMADVPLGETDGRKKTLGAPMLLLLRKRSGERLPAAIQCGQTPGADTPIYTPADGAAWDMAKMVVQVADANFQGVVSHLGYCHLVMEAVIVSAERQLAPNHPLKILLKPHFQFTLATNAVLFNLVMIAIYMVDGFAYAAETLVGQAIGARRRERYRDAIRLATRWALAAAVLLSLTLWLAGTHIVAFMTTSPEVRVGSMASPPKGSPDG